MTATVFVQMYHPALDNVRVECPQDAVDEYEARGWIVVDGNAPEPAATYLTPGTGDLRYLKLGDVGKSGTTTGDALSAAYVSVQRPQIVGYLGDSLSIAAATNLSAQTTWAQVARALLGCRYDHGVQAGVGGQTSTQIAARVADVTGANPKPSICIVHAGANSITTDVPATTVINDLTAIITALRAAAITPVILTLIPSVNYTGARAAEAAKVNKWIKALPRTLGVPAIDWRPAVSDWSATAGTWLAALTVDGVHPNEKGHVALARAVADGLAPLITGPTPLVGGAGAVNGIVTANPGMTGSGGTNGTAVTGTIPASWTFNQTATGTSSVVPRTDHVGGNWWQLDLTDAQPAQAFIQNTNVGVDWNVGDLVCAEAEIMLPSAPSNLSALPLRLDFWGGGNLIISVSDNALSMPPSTTIDLPAGVQTPMVLRTPPTVAPAGTERLQFYLVIKRAASPLAASLRIGRAGIRKL